MCGTFLGPLIELDKVDGRQVGAERPEQVGGDHTLLLWTDELLLLLFGLTQVET